MSDELTIEKINADRINKMEERFERRLDAMDNKLDRILQASATASASKPVNGNGNAAWVRQSIGLVIAVVAILAFMIPTFVAVVEPVKLQQKMFMEQVNHNWNTVSSHMLDGHPVKVEQKLESLDRLVHRRMDDMQDHQKEIIRKCQKHI